MKQIINGEQAIERSENVRKDEFDCKNEIFNSVKDLMTGEILKNAHVSADEKRENKKAANILHVECLNLNLKKQILLDESNVQAVCDETEKEIQSIDESRFIDSEVVAEDDENYFNLALNELVRRKLKRRAYLKNVKNSTTMENDTATFDANNLISTEIFNKNLSKEEEGMDIEKNSDKLDAVCETSFAINDINVNGNLERRKLIRSEKVNGLKQKNLSKSFNATNHDFFSKDELTNIINLSDGIILDQIDSEPKDKKTKSPQFTSDLKSQKVLDGSLAKFSLQILAESFPGTVRWLRNDKDVSLNYPNIISDYNAETGEASLIIPEDAGDYMCIAENKFGAASISASLVVETYEYVPDSKESVCSLDEKCSEADWALDIKEEWWKDSNVEVNGSSIGSDLKISQVKSSKLFNEGLETENVLSLNADINKISDVLLSSEKSLSIAFQLSSTEKFDLKDGQKKLQITECESKTKISSWNKKLQSCSIEELDSTKYQSTDDLYLDAPEVLASESSKEPTLVDFHFVQFNFAQLNHAKLTIKKQDLEKTFIFSKPSSQKLVPISSERFKVFSVKVNRIRFETPYISRNVPMFEVKPLPVSHSTDKVTLQICKFLNVRSSQLNNLKNYHNFSQETYALDIIYHLIQHQVKTLKPKINVIAKYNLNTATQNNLMVRCALNFCMVPQISLSKQDEIINIEFETVALYDDLYHNEEIYFKVDGQFSICRYIPCYENVEAEKYMLLHSEYQKNKVNLAPSITQTEVCEKDDYITTNKSTKRKPENLNLQNKLHLDQLKFLRSCRKSVSSDPGTKVLKKYFFPQTLQSKYKRNISRSISSLDSRKSIRSSRKASFASSLDSYPLRSYCSEFILNSNTLPKYYFDQMSNPISYLSIGSSFKKSFSDLDSIDSSLSILSLYEKNYAKLSLPNNLLSEVTLNYVHSAEEFNPIVVASDLKNVCGMKCQLFEEKMIDFENDLTVYKACFAMNEKETDCEASIIILKSDNKLKDFDKISSQKETASMKRETNFKSSHEIIEEETKRTLQSESFRSNQFSKLQNSPNLTNLKNNPPTIISHLQNHQVLDGASAELTCQIKSDLPVQVTWLLDGLEICPNHEVIIREHENNVFTLTITEVLPEDEGLYCLQASNEFGECYTTAYLTVLSW
ncbi:hypothetical protein HELRODRAFT_170422 [Helobdella robusta]|uniref:Ig-like domain-containing protein n=1 Tax=Helobdella robusta TaxID=6412 RepID=T1F313_HELRO|nr:hypothetical protein HELRODRAFT_170422 [Helobdella robusta]ESO07121.1 hypothetical protein HELRODRAFT_170422 [Helobdella robusta]